jgi:hypothetical protein
VIAGLRPLLPAPAAEAQEQPSGESDARPVP